MACLDVAGIPSAINEGVHSKPVINKPESYKTHVSFYTIFARECVRKESHAMQTISVVQKHG